MKTNRRGFIGTVAAFFAGAGMAKAEADVVEDFEDDDEESSESSHETSYSSSGFEPQLPRPQGPLVFHPNCRCTLK